MAEINYRIILKIIGVLLWLEAASMLMPLGISIYYGENDTTAFLITIGIAAVIGSILFFQYPNTERKTLGNETESWLFPYAGYVSPYWALCLLFYPGLSIIWPKRFLKQYPVLQERGPA